MPSKISCYAPVVAAAATKLATSKEMLLTALAITVLSNIPTVSAGGATYAKCFKACMDASGNVALVAFPICAAACTPALVF